MTAPSATATALDPANPVQATREAMSSARLPLAYRDKCASLLIPLNKCRVQEYYLPWKCEDERHSYEKCQYLEFKKRVTKMEELRAAKGGARSGLN
ncbi:NADH-ubiquinone oxidoreductase B18 subunit [Peziza echinospora]|nr:NADH-ubiquinone oxidoreductase B18 subunit [Peziza echinospora]